MAKFAEYLVFGFIWFFLFVVLGVFSFSLPRALIRSLREGVVFVNQFAIRRANSPLLFWPVWITGVVAWAFAVKMFLALFGIA